MSIGADVKLHNYNSTIHSTGAGACTVTAPQGGDANFNAAADASQSFNISKGQTITFNGLAKGFGVTLISRLVQTLHLPVSVLASRKLHNYKRHDSSNGRRRAPLRLRRVATELNAAAMLADFQFQSQPDDHLQWSGEQDFGDADFPSAQTSSVSVSFWRHGKLHNYNGTIHLTAPACTVAASQGGDANHRCGRCFAELNISKAIRRSPQWSGE